MGVLIRNRRPAEQKACSGFLHFPPTYPSLKTAHRFTHRPPYFAYALATSLVAFNGGVQIISGGPHETKAARLAMARRPMVNGLLRASELGVDADVAVPRLYHLWPCGALSKEICKFRISVAAGILGLTGGHVTAAGLRRLRRRPQGLRPPSGHLHMAAQHVAL